MMPAYMHPGVIYVDVNVDFLEDGTLVPKTLLYEKIYVVEQVLSTHLLSEEEVEAIFPPPPRCKYDITQYKVRLQGGATASLYFDRWPLGDPQSLGRWFVVKKTG